MKKYNVGIAAFCAGITILAAAETENLNQPDAWSYVNGKGARIMQTEYDGETVLEIKGSGNFQSRRLMPVDPAKIYKLSGVFRAAPGTVPSRFYLGLIPYDARKVRIQSGEISIVPGTDTVLAEAAKKGGRVLRVTDASRWQKDGPLCAAFNTSPDFKDLPNRNLSPGIKNIEKKGNVWEIALASPLSADYPAGTGIREHRHGSSFLYSAAGNQPVPAEWQTFSALVKGEIPYGISFSSWWKGTRFVRLGILANTDGNADSRLLFKNVKLEELSR